MQPAIKSLILIPALAIASVVGSPATAQDMPVMDWGPMMHATAMGSAMDAAAKGEHTSVGDRISATIGEQSVVGSGVSTSSAAAVSFRPSSSRRRANLAQFVEKSRAADPQGAAAMEQLFAQHDIIESLESELAPYGLRTDNLADAYTAWWMSAWQAAHGDLSDPTREQSQAVKAQATRALLATPEVASATDAQKQEFAEALLVQAALISAFQAKYKDDAVLTRRMEAAVRQGAKASGVDLDAMTLTANGFVPAGRHGAADTDKAEALASTTPAPAQPPYALMAAAGGAGLGAVFLIGKAMGRRG